jgi:hypothetical protein
MTILRCGLMGIILVEGALVWKAMQYRHPRFKVTHGGFQLLAAGLTESSLYASVIGVEGVGPVQVGHAFCRTGS